MVDITKRRQDKQVLRPSEEHLRHRCGSAAGDKVCRPTGGDAPGVSEEFTSTDFQEGGNSTY